MTTDTSNATIARLVKHLRIIGELESAATLEQLAREREADRKDAERFDLQRNVLAPRQPTPEMLGAMRRVSFSRHADMYRAAIAAAPQTDPESRSAMPGRESSTTIGVSSADGVARGRTDLLILHVDTVDRAGTVSAEGGVTDAMVVAACAAFDSSTGPKYPAMEYCERDMRAALEAALAAQPASAQAKHECVTCGKQKSYLVCMDCLEKDTYKHPSATATVVGEFSASAQADAEPEPKNLFAPGDEVSHRKGGEYVVLFRADYEPTMQDCYVYRGTDGHTWVRPALVMEDGRFTLIRRAQAGSAEPVAMELVPVEPKPECWIDGADIGHLRDGAVEHVYAYAKQILPCMVPVYTAPAPGRSEKPNDVVAAGWREVTLEDALSYRANFSSERELNPSEPLQDSALRALRSIGAVIRTDKGG